MRGTRKEGWDNPNSGATNGMHCRDPSLTVQDIIDNMLRKQAFGIDDYNPKATVKDLLPVHTHVRAKQKRRMFCEEASLAKDKVPAPTKYQTAIDWAKDPVSRNIKFYRNERRVIADEIMHKAKQPEKTTPGPAAFSSQEGWEFTKGKPHGTTKIKEDIITFVQERKWFADQTPGFKYPSIDLVSFKNKN